MEYWGCAGLGCMLIPIIGWIVGPFLIVPGLIEARKVKKTGTIGWHCNRCLHSWRLPKELSREEGTPDAGNSGGSGANGE